MKIDKSYKIIPKPSTSESREIQEICFADGFTTAGLDCVAARLHFPCIEIDSKERVIYRLLENDVAAENYEEISAPDFIKKFK